MKNKVLKTIGYIVGITWLFTACALDDEVYGMTMLFINALHQCSVHGIPGTVLLGK